MFVVLQWYFNDRDGKAIFPELTATYGPFDDQEAAKDWIAAAETWGGWGPYEYQLETLNKV